MNRSVTKTETPQMKIAIVHNWLWKMRGAEHCLEAMCEIFPQADIYALFGNSGDESSLSETIRKHNIYFSWLNNIPFIKRLYRFTLPLWPKATERWDLSGYDLVISSSASSVKGVITPPETVHISYMYTPMRYLWDQRNLYLSKKSGPTKLLFSLTAHFLRIWDSNSTKRIDKIISISEFVSDRIRKYYRREPDVLIYPPVDLSRFDKVEVIDHAVREDSSLVISAYEENKGAKEALEFASKTGIELIIVGDGVERNKLEKKYEEFTNIKFLPWLSDIELAELIARSKALLFLGVEDFGIVPLEASYLGTPVIAYNKGGARETIVEELNGIFINDTDPVSITNAYDKVKARQWDKKKMKAHVLKFDKELFKNRLRDYVTEVMGEEREILP